MVYCTDCAPNAPRKTTIHRIIDREQINPVVRRLNFNILESIPENDAIVPSAPRKIFRRRIINYEQLNRIRRRINFNILDTVSEIDDSVVPQYINANITNILYILDILDILDVDKVPQMS